VAQRLERDRKAYVRLQGGLVTCHRRAILLDHGQSIILICRIPVVISSMRCLCRSLTLPDKNLGQPATGLERNGPTGTGAKVSLELTPISNVTLSDRYDPGERAQCRPSASAGCERPPRTSQSARSADRHAPAMAGGVQPVPAVAAFGLPRGADSSRPLSPLALLGPLTQRARWRREISGLTGI
jgi:hypothetical protein